jgi:hypothetical protein
MNISELTTEQLESLKHAMMNGINLVIEHTLFEIEDELQKRKLAKNLDKKD